MSKQFTPFAGRKLHIDNLLARKQTITDYRPAHNAYEVQAIVENIGLVYYITGADLIVKFFETFPEVPIRDKRIVKDYRGYFFEDNVFSLDEEEARLRRKYGVAYGNPNIEVDTSDFLPQDPDTSLEQNPQEDSYQSESLDSEQISPQVPDQNVSQDPVE